MNPIGVGEVFNTEPKPSVAPPVARRFLIFILISLTLTLSKWSVDLEGSLNTLGLVNPDNFTPSNNNSVNLSAIFLSLFPNFNLLKPSKLCSISIIKYLPLSIFCEGKDISISSAGRKVNKLSPLTSMSINLPMLLCEDNNLVALASASF